MRRVKRLGWVMGTVLMLGGIAPAARAADKADKELENRVRALEKSLEQQQAQQQGQQKEAADTKSVKERVDAIEKDVKDSKDAIAKMLGVEIHGFVATDYNYNFNSPDSRTNRIHVFDEDANTFALDQANINIQRNKPEGLGFNLDLDFGKTAEVVGRATRWSGGTGAGESANSVELRQAYLKYTIPNTSFTIQAGKFVTYHGAEVIKSYNSFNYNISNSILFGNSIPFTHTGVLGTYAFGDLASVSAGLVNGWDNVSDNNDGKSVHGMFTLTPAPIFSFSLSGTYGPEQDNNGRSKRLMITPLFTIKPIDQLTFIIDYNYGNESNVAVPPGGIVANPNLTQTSLAQAPGNAMWQGVAGYVIVAATDALQVALRGEVFDDPDGVRTLFQQHGFGPGATFWEITPTVSYKITEGLTWRAEYRHDESDKRFFDKNNRTVANGALGQNGQDIIATELIYAF